MLILAVSKDSDVLLDLCIKSGVDFEAQHNHTSVDAPETVYHIREVFERVRKLGITCTINYPKMTMWQLIPYKGMPPTRMIRYCCDVLKERVFENQHIMTGVRWNESSKRQKRGVHENLTSKKQERVVYFDENDDKQKLTNICLAKNRIATNPIIDWTVLEVWDYINKNNIKTNILYEKGFIRVGCIGCPMASYKRMKKEFAIYPTYKKAYIKAFDRMLETCKRRGTELNERWKSGEAVMAWWLGEDINQMNMFTEGE